jgi:hypothetical protein
MPEKYILCLLTGAIYKNICADAIFDYFYDTNMLMNIMLSVKSVRSKTIQDKDK